MVRQLRSEMRRERIRRWWRSLAQYTGLRFWLVSRGLFLFAVAGVVYLAAGWTVGWRMAYEIAVGITSPASVGSSSWPSVVLAWVVSLAGWLAVPGIAGAVAGYVVAAYADQRRDLNLDAFLPSASAGEDPHA